MNDIILKLSGMIDDLHNAGILTLRNACIGFVVAIVLVILPSRGLKRLGLIITLVLTVIALLVFLVKVAHLDTLL